MGCPRVGDRLRDVHPQVPAAAVGDLVELGGGQFAPGPLGGPVGRVDEAERGVLDGLGGRVVAQVGGEERVDARRAHGVEQAVAGAAADGDPADRRVGVAGDADALRAAKAARVSGGSSSQIRPRPFSGTRGPVTRSPRAPARASETPGSAVSALVCATCRAMSCLMRVCTTRPLKWVAATVVVPRR